MRVRRALSTLTGHVVISIPIACDGDRVPLDDGRAGARERRRPAPIDPSTTLACYATDPLGTAVGPLEVTNAFHTASLDVAAPLAVCVPALANTSASP